MLYEYERSIKNKIFNNIHKYSIVYICIVIALHDQKIQLKLYLYDSLKSETIFHLVIDTLLNVSRLVYIF